MENLRAATRKDKKLEILRDRREVSKRAGQSADSRGSLEVSSLSLVAGSSEPFAG